MMMGNQIHGNGTDGGEWSITNQTTWTIYVQDADTKDHAAIPPDETVRLQRGSGKLVVNSMGDRFTFTTEASKVTILELFKGQLILRPDEFVCCNDEDDVQNDNDDCQRCKYCPASAQEGF